jgi:hypothetical protein
MFHNKINNLASSCTIACTIALRITLMRGGAWATGGAYVTYIRTLQQKWKMLSTPFRLMHKVVAIGNPVCYAVYVKATTVITNCYNMLQLHHGMLQLLITNCYNSVIYDHFLLQCALFS